MPTRRRWLARLSGRRIRAEVEEAVARRAEALERRYEAIVRSEARYARAVEASNAGLYDWDIANDEMYQSPRMKELFGVAPDTCFAGRADFMAHVPLHPEDRKRIEDVVAAAFAARLSRYEIDYRILLPEGGTRWLRSYGQVFRDAGGQPAWLSGVVLDVTDQKRAQEALAESESRFRSLIQLSSDWYWRQDENLRFNFLSSQALDLTGHTGESSYGKRRWELSGMTPLSGSWDEHKAVLAARQPFRDLECCRVGTDGVTRYLSMSGTPMFDHTGGFIGYQGVGRNITERKRIEEELRARQEMLDMAQQAAHAAAFEWRTGEVGEDVRWSPDLEAMCGLVPGSYDGAYETWRKLFHPDDWPLVDAAIRHAGPSGEVAVEHRVLLAGGTTRWLQTKGRVSFDGQGQPVRMVGFMIDVTERHQAEDELRRLERQLRQAQRLEAMGTLAGGIAHDFNNILGAILGYGEMALRDAPKGSRLRRDLDRIMTATERGRALVEQILTFSRSSVNERVPVHLERVVREALDQFAAQLPHQVSIEPHLRAGRAAVLGDPTQAHQLLMNLATNAFQAMMPAGGTVRVRLEPLHLAAPRAATTGMVAAGDHVILQVADSGSGIPPEIVDRIFDPFFTTKEVGVGTGLGLSLVHSIVTDLGGAIDVASEPGRGSTFTVYLPRAGDAPETGEREIPELPRGEGERVMVVDDEEPLMLIAIETLEDIGYRPVGFTSSLEALDAFRADPRAFGAVVTDERMPEMTGSALIRELRVLNAAIPIVLMSGFIGTVGSARDTGADEVLKKPLSRRDLAAGLARVLQRGQRAG
ncbi:PAS domain-containing protein [Variovorax sp. JS1663]|uniref:PAS domain-containing protein n=1 Tax=Variovorax sp. JS1663 TaxID=1851577 RepID=UPI000B3462CA|nr:PAS domain-containing protein [Variovorax sp. JS1663]OUM02845.1 hypothetical protein A8M77_09630 [Variovorax sp. JS1663]